MVETWKKTRGIGNSVVAFSGARQADFHSINLEMVALLQLPTLCFSHTGFNSQKTWCQQRKGAVTNACVWPAKNHGDHKSPTVALTAPPYDLYLIDKQQAYFRRARVFSLFQSLTVRWRDSILTWTAFSAASILPQPSANPSPNPQTYFTPWPCVVDSGVILPQDTPTHRSFK